MISVVFRMPGHRRTQTTSLTLSLLMALLVISTACGDSTAEDAARPTPGTDSEPTALFGTTDEMDPESRALVEEVNDLFALPPGADYEEPDPAEPPVPIAKSTLISGSAYAAGCLWTSYLLEGVDNGDPVQVEEAVAGATALREQPESGQLTDEFVDEVLRGARSNNHDFARRHVELNC